MLRREGETVNAKRVYRLWRENGLSHRPEVRKRRWIGSSENSCVRLKPSFPNHVWSYDVLFDATADGRRLKWMPVIDDYTRECLVLGVDRSITAAEKSSVIYSKQESSANRTGKSTTPNVHTAHSSTRHRRNLQLRKWEIPLSPRHQSNIHPGTNIGGRSEGLTCEAIEEPLGAFTVRLTRIALKPNKGGVPQIYRPAGCVLTETSLDSPGVTS